MSRDSLPFLTLAVVGILTVAALLMSLSMVVPPTTHPKHPNPFGAAEYGFGGYSVNQRTTEIGAEWRVPTISPHSQFGGAATWIAVQNKDRQFIQIGTNEVQIDGTATYQVFWSDVTVHFHPQQLLFANARDLITFKMTQTARGWRLGVDDLTLHVQHRRFVAYARGATFTSAQWLQENPTLNGLATHISYPTITPTTFSHLSLNGATPVLKRSESQVLMTANGVYLIPSAPAHDQFTFVNATGPARQYLSDVFPYDAALYLFQLDLYYHRPVSARDLRRIRSALVTLDSKFTSQTWPEDLTSAVKGDTKLVADLENEFDHYPAAPGRINPEKLDHFHALEDRDAHYAATLRRDLGLPPVK